MGNTRKVSTSKASTAKAATTRRQARPALGASGAAASSPAVVASADTAAAAAYQHALPGQVVLVLQGGGALGAYQGGVYQAMHEAGIEPDWVIGTSIGAINGALIAGNRRDDRLQRLKTFWQRLELTPEPPDFFGLRQQISNLSTVLRGIPGFFSPSNAALLGPSLKLGIEKAAYYSTEPLRQTLEELVDFEYLGAGPRLTVGAVHVQAGEIRYFDRRDEKLAACHILASGALPPAFPAVRINGEPYWDGGVYSNTPIEAVLDDKPRRDSVIFSVNVWQPHGDEPQSINEAMSRLKDIQYASRTDSHIERQRQNHRLRHIIRQLYNQLDADKRADPNLRALASWGCGTTMHILRLQAPAVPGEDQSKDIDFTRAGVAARWQAGYEDTLNMIACAPWAAPTDPIEGVIVHNLPGR